MNLENLIIFCNEVKENENLKFIIAKHSEEQPYWSVFACVMENRKKKILGSCFVNELSVESVLDLISGLDCKVEINNKFMS